MKTADRLVREGVKGKIISVITKPNTDWFGFILEEGKEIGDEIYFRVVSKEKKTFFNFESPVILLYFIKIFILRMTIKLMVITVVRKLICSIL